MKVPNKPIVNKGIYFGYTLRINDHTENGVMSAITVEYKRAKHELIGFRICKRN